MSNQMKRESHDTQKDTLCELRYVFTFLIKDRKRLMDRINAAGWKSEKGIFDSDQSFRISRYFNFEVSKLYLSDVNYYSLDKYSNIGFLNDEGTTAKILSCRILLFPSDIGQVILNVDAQWLDGNREYLSNLHKDLRAWSNSYSYDGTPHGASSLRFFHTESDLYDDFNPDTFDTNSFRNCCALLSFLLGLKNEDHDSTRLVVDPVCDRRSPALLFVSCDEHSLSDKSFLYKLVAGDGAETPLPSDDYIEGFLVSREASPYFGTSVEEGNSSRSIVDGYGWLFAGSFNNDFFNKVVRDSSGSIYLVLFSLLWYQYAFLYSSLLRVEQVSKLNGDPQTKEIEGIILNIGTYLKPSLLSFGSREEQALLLMEIGQRTLGIERLYEKLESQTNYWHNYAVTVETRSTANAAIIIGLLSILGLVVSVLSGLAALGSQNMPNALEKLVPPLLATSLAGLLGVLVLGYFPKLKPRGFHSSVITFYVLPYTILLVLFTLAVGMAPSFD